MQKVQSSKQKVRKSNQGGVKRSPLGNLLNS